MARLTIDAPYLERRAFAKQWDAQQSELEAAGHEVEFAEHTETRSGLPGVGIEPGTLVVIAIWLARELAGETVDGVAAGIRQAVLAKLRGRLRGNPKRTVVVVDQHERTLLVVEVPEGDEDDTP